MKTLFIAFASFLAGVCVSVAINSRAGGDAPFAKALQVPKQQFYVEAAVGQCRLSRSPENMWWRGDMENSSHFKTNWCPQFGAALDVGPIFGFSARWVNLGNATVNSIVVSCPDDDCSKADPTKYRRPECNNGPNENCIQRTRGSWNVRGMLFTINAEAFNVAGISVRPEAGAYVYRVRGTVRVMPIGCDESRCPWSADIVQQTGYYISPEVGLMLHWRNVFVGTQYFLRTTQHTNISAGIGGPAQTWVAGVRVPF